MSDDAAPADSAIGLIELSSVAVGIATGDATVKASPLKAIHSGSVHPGKYLVLVSGDTASVEEALAVGRGAAGSSTVDTLFLPDVDPAVVRAMLTASEAADFGDEALGIVETVAAAIEAADAGVKAAEVELIAVRLADGLGGKGYLLFSGVLAQVEAATEAASDRAAPGGHLLEGRVVAQLHPELAENLRADLRFAARTRGGG